MAYFTEKFGDFVCDGDTITCEVDGFTITATIHADDDGTPPWQREDGHGPVSDWTSRSKAPGERVLNTDHGSHRFYDFAEAVKIARRDGWGSKGDDGLTAGAKAERAAEHDFKVLKAWCDDEWHYVGVTVQVSRQCVDLTGEYSHALWGIEANYPDSDNAYLTEVAEELVDEALKDARAKLAMAPGSGPDLNSGNNPMMTPTIHMNGTSKLELLQQICDAMTAVLAAQEALGKASPHGRDYYPQGGEAILRAQREHRDRVSRLRSVYAELEAIGEAIA